MRPGIRRIPFLILLVLSLVIGGCSASEAKRDAAEGARLYDRGDYDGALPLLEESVSQGVDDGQVFYRLAYIYEVKGQPDKVRSAREKAEPLLARQAASEGGTLEDSYYLTALYAGLQRAEDMRKAAEAGVKKFGQRSDLSGEDLFRLGRLHQFAGRGELAAAAYRKATEAMAKEPDPNPILFALALISDAGTDLQARRYTEAAQKLEKAESLNPKSPPDGYRMALADLGAERYAQARERFGRVRDEATATEAQYGADVARHLEVLGKKVEKTADGKTFLEMDNVALEASLKAAAQSYREAKGGGKAHPESLAEAERLFFSLTAEWMLRGNSLREVSLSGKFADLIRQ